MFFLFQELYGRRSSRVVRFLLWLWKNSFARLGEDWVYLALLGIIMALLSYVMDKGISMCTNGKLKFSIDDVFYPKINNSLKFQLESGCTGT